MSTVLVASFDTGGPSWSLIQAHAGQRHMFLMVIPFAHRPKTDRAWFVGIPMMYNTHLVIQNSHGKSAINRRFNGKIIYKWAIFHGYVRLPEGNHLHQSTDLVRNKKTRMPSLTGSHRRSSTALTRRRLPWMMFLAKCFGRGQRDHPIC